MEEAARGFLDAAVNGDLPAIQKLLDRGKECINSCVDQDGSTALHLAASRGQAPLVLALLSAGADPTATNQARQTPVHLALMSQPRSAADRKEVLALLEKGMQLWSLPPHPLDITFLPRLKELATLEPSNEAGSASRLLALGMLPALQQRLRVFGRGPLPGTPSPHGNHPLVQPHATPGAQHTSSDPAAGTSSSSQQPRVVSTGDVSAFCHAMAAILRAIGDLQRVCFKSADHKNCALQAIRQLLSDRFSLVAVVEKGLAPAVLQAPPWQRSSFAALGCMDSVQGIFLLVCQILYNC